MINNQSSPLKPWQSKIQRVIFEADTTAGKLFDIVLIGSILISVAVIMLDSVHHIRQQYGTILFIIDWVVTILFSIEYLLRLSCVGRPLSYALSFYGLIDLFSILPTYFSLLIPGTHYLSAIRIFRVLRVFRVLKLVQYIGEANILASALRDSRKKITVFLITVMTMVIVLGSIMYLIEGEKNGFTSIPMSVYWAVVTMTTVGYGDVSPHTPLGQALSMLIMIIGYSIIAVPTGIVTNELVNKKQTATTQACPQCSLEGHDKDAIYCKYCGSKL